MESAPIQRLEDGGGRRKGYKYNTVVQSNGSAVINFHLPIIKLGLGAFRNREVSQFTAISFRDFQISMCFKVLLSIH